jgi:hypothetical protein
MHSPIISPLGNFVQNQLNYEIKLNIIVDIFSGILDLLEKELFADPLN